MVKGWNLIISLTCSKENENRIHYVSYFFYSLVVYTIYNTYTMELEKYGSRSKRFKHDLITMRIYIIKEYKGACGLILWVINVYVYNIGCVHICPRRRRFRFKSIYIYIKVLYLLAINFCYIAIWSLVGVF